MIDVSLIINVLIAIILYNMIVKSIGAIIIKELLRSEKGKEAKKTFKEKLKDKLQEND